MSWVQNALQLLLNKETIFPLGHSHGFHNILPADFLQIMLISNILWIRYYYTLLGIILIDLHLLIYFTIELYEVILLFFYYRFKNPKQKYWSWERWSNPELNSKWILKLNFEPRQSVSRAFIPKVIQLIK